MNAFDPTEMQTVGDLEEEFRESRVIYLASPYSHPDKRVMQWRFDQAVAAAGEMMKRGDIVFSPIAHSHEIGMVSATAKNHEFWMAQDLPWLEKSDELHVLCLDGWPKSRGVQEEIEFARSKGILVVFRQPSEFGLLTHAPDLGRDTSKDTNPKDGIGATKLPLGLVPATAIALASLAHLEGACKYGKWNWRAAGVRASIYVDAAMRHIERWNNGEDNDPESGISHIGHALACLNILVDASACGKLNDDRAPRIDIKEWIAALTPHVKRIQEQYADRDPRHYTVADS